MSHHIQDAAYNHSRHRHRQHCPDVLASHNFSFLFIISPGLWLGQIVGYRFGQKPPDRVGCFRPISPSFSAELRKLWAIAQRNSAQAAIKPATPARELCRVCESSPRLRFHGNRLVVIAHSGAHDLSTGGAILDHSFSTRPLRRTLFCCCHSSASAFLCHGDSFLLLRFDVYRCAARYVIGWRCAMGCNPTAHGSMCCAATCLNRRRFAKGNNACRRGRGMRTGVSAPHD